MADEEKASPPANGIQAGDNCSSSSIEEPSPVPRSKDEPTSDFLVRFAPTGDPWNPQNLPVSRKWVITLTVAMSAFCVTVNSTLYTFTYSQLMPEFGVSREVCTLGLTSFVIGLAIGPMVLAPLSEFYGRRPVYIGAFVQIFIWLIPCAVAQNIQTIIVTRFLDGLFASSFLSVAGGTVSDMFEKKDLSLPMMLYSASCFLGPSLGPVIGGFINYYTSWRWSFWVLLIWTGTQCVAIYLLIPETYFPVRLRDKARQLRKETGDERWRAPIEIMDKSLTRTILRSCYRPFLLLTLEPMCLNLCLISALLLGILYLFFGAFPIVFETNHGFTLWQTGLAFCGLLVGMIVSVITDTVWSRHYTMLVRRNGGVSEPEFRLPPTVVGVWFCVAGLFGFGWTTFSRADRGIKQVHWIVPIILSSLFGFGIVICFKGIFTFQVEAYPLWAASSLAANSFARSVFAASFPLFGVQMYERLGFQWASSLLGFLMLALAPFPYIFYKHGKRIRGNSRFAADPTGS